MAELHDKATRSFNMSRIKDKKRQVRDAGTILFYIPENTGLSIAKFVVS